MAFRSNVKPALLRPAKPRSAQPSPGQPSQAERRSLVLKERRAATSARVPSNSGPPRITRDGPSGLACLFEASKALHSTDQASHSSRTSTGQPSQGQPSPGQPSPAQPSKAERRSLVLKERRAATSARVPSNSGPPRITRGGPSGLAWLFEAITALPSTAQTSHHNRPYKGQPCQGQASHIVQRLFVQDRSKARHTSRFWW
jgi:hypothetical protein